MDLLRTDAGGNMLRADLDRLGGAYPLPARLLRGGTGSPRLVYRSGVPHFDASRRAEREDTAFVSIEELRGGMVLRQNINQRVTCVGALNRQIESVRLLAHRMLIRTHKRFGSPTRLVHFGELSIVTREGGRIEILVLVPVFSVTLQYFRRSGWKERFRHEVSDRPIVTDEGDYVLDYRSLLRFLGR